MDMLKPFLIPIAGLKIGIHQFDFQIDGPFFQQFESSPIKAATIALELELDKQSEMIVLQFRISGTVPSACDRCLADINLPIHGDYPLIIKYRRENQADEAELVYIDRDESTLDISKYAYEFIVISLPLIKVYDCEEDDPIPCNEALLDRLYETPDDEDDSNKDNPIWDALKDLK